MRGASHKLYSINSLFLIFFIHSHLSFSNCFDTLKNNLPPLPALKDVNLYTPIKSPEGVQDAVVAAIITEGKILMLQRGAEIGKGTWGLVGGKIEEGESLIEALEWEAWEEIGLDHLSDFSLFDIHYHIVPDSKKIFRVFVIRAERELTQNPVAVTPENWEACKLSHSA